MPINSTSVLVNSQETNIGVGIWRCPAVGDEVEIADPLAQKSTKVMCHTFPDFVHVCLHGALIRKGSVGVSNHRSRRRLRIGLGVEVREGFLRRCCMQYEASFEGGLRSRTKRGGRRRSREAIAKLYECRYARFHAAKADVHAEFHFIQLRRLNVGIGGQWESVIKTR